MPNQNVEAIKAILDEVVEAMRKAAPPNVLVGEYATDFLAECLAARGVLLISDAGTGPYWIEPEGHMYDVCWPEPSEQGIYASPSEFMIGSHSKEVATAICAFMNYWAHHHRETSKS